MLLHQMVASSKNHAVFLQANELLGLAFEIFAKKDYCVVTLPHDSAEPALMASMTRLPPLPGASYPEVYCSFIAVISLPLRYLIIFAWPLTVIVIVRIGPLPFQSERSPGWL